MKNKRFDRLEIEAHPGEMFSTVAERAMYDAKSYGRKEKVWFSFNGISCVVTRGTNLEWLYRDYQNAFTMDWKEVGPDCVAEYSAEVQAELLKRDRLSQERQAARRIESDRKEQIQRELFAEKTKGVVLELADGDLWQNGLANNTDPYGACIYEYAESWAKLMQAEMAKGSALSDCAERTSFELGYLGITGFMYGAAVSVLSACWKHGETLRRWHNREYDYAGTGVVNPAIITLSK